MVYFSLASLGHLNNKQVSTIQTTQSYNSSVINLVLFAKIFRKNNKFKMLFYFFFFYKYLDIRNLHFFLCLFAYLCYCKSIKDIFNEFFPSCKILLLAL